MYHAMVSLMCHWFHHIYQVKTDFGNIHHMEIMEYIMPMKQIRNEENFY